MQNITSAAELKNAIQLLEVEQAEKGQLLKEQFYLTYESLKTVNLIKSTLMEVVSSPFLIDNILGTAMGMATGYLSKKIFIGASGTILKKLLGPILKLGVTSAVAQPINTVKLLGKYVFQRFHHKK